MQLDQNEGTPVHPGGDAHAMQSAYVFGPFALDSDIPLPELPHGDASHLRPVTIRIAPKPLAVDGLQDIFPWMAASPEQFLLTIAGTGRFLVSSGERVEIELDPGAHEIDLRLYLMGSVFGALCHQNGYLPLHASAIERGGRVTAFLGDSGAGKSTLAAFLSRRGHSVISDDICLLGQTREQELSVTPVAGWLKLWRKSLDALGESAVEANRLISKDDKFRVYLPPGAPGAPQLHCLVLLERPQDSSAHEPPRLESVSTATALARVMDTVYLSEAAQVSKGEQALFERCARLISQVRVLRLIAPLGFDRMDEVLDLIETELL